MTAFTFAACASTSRDVGSAGDVSSAPATASHAHAASPRHTAADVEFMQHMIHHHAQALVMTRLVPTRSERRNIRMLAERIEVSQRDEIALMQQWLRERSEPVPAVPMDHHHHAEPAHADMPGMITPEQLDRLAASRGTAFDRLFLELMIRHHEGALTMVADLFATPGAAQEPALFQLASDVDADQRMEIERMRRVLTALPAPAGSERSDP